MGTIIIFLIGLVAFFVMFVVINHQDAEKEKEKLETAKRTVVKTKFIDSSHIATQTATPKVGSAIGRAVIGDWVAGPAGAIVGSATAKQKVTVNEKHTTTFMVYYKDGHRQHETVDDGTKLYNFYMDMLDLD